MKKTNISLNLSRLEGQVFANALLFAANEMPGLSTHVRQRIKLMAGRLEDELQRVAKGD